MSLPFVCFRSKLILLHCLACSVSSSVFIYPDVICFITPYSERARTHQIRAGKNNSFFWPLMPRWLHAISMSSAIILLYFHYPGSSTRRVQGSSALWQEVWCIQLWGTPVGDVPLLCALHADGLGPGKILVFCTHFHESDKSQNGPAQILVVIFQLYCWLSCIVFWGSAC